MERPRAITPASSDTAFRDRARREPPVGRDPDSPAVAQWPAPDGAMASARAGGDAAAPRAPQTIGLNFKAITLADSNSSYPPNPSGDVGPEQILVATDGRIRLFDRSGTTLGLDTDLDTFFDDVRANQAVSEPQVRYDRLSGRFFVAAVTSGFPNRIVIAVSSASVLTDTTSFTFFFIQQDTVSPAGQTGQRATDLSLGVDKFALYLGANVYNVSGLFTAASGYLVRKASLLSGGPISAQAFRGIGTTTSGGLWAPRGVDNDDPAATQGYFIGVDIRVTGRLVLRRVTNPATAPSTISANINITVPDTALPQSVPTAGTSFPLDALDDRLFAARISVNRLTGVPSLWTAHNILVDATGVGTTGGDRDGARWYEIRNLTSTPLLAQSGTLFDTAETQPRFFFIPSVAMSGQGHVALASSTSGETNFADAAVAGRLGSDALGTTQAFTPVTFSDTPYDDGFSFPEYWGTRSATVVDPNDAMTMWTFQEWCENTNSWGVQVAQLVAPPPASPVSAGMVCQGLSSADITVTGTSSSGSAFFDPGPDPGGPGYASHLGAAITGVVVNGVTVNSATQVTVNVSTTGSALGPHDVTITNPDGQAATGTGILTVTSAPSAPSAGADSPACAGGTLHLSASTIPGATYAWTGPNGFTSTEQNPVLSGVTAADAGTYSVTASMGGCSSAASTVDVTVIGDGATCAACGLCQSGACVVADSDSDGVADGCDCAPGDASAWAVPGDAATLNLTHTPPGAGGVTSLSWSAPATGGTAAGMLYDVVRSSVAADFVAAGICVESDDGPNTVATDASAPAAGGIFFYVVRPQDACGPGVSHRDKDGNPRPARDCP
ncbi:MAG TPA: immunoglobulin domain-containing protein [Candidatus Polarisedimenticolia bacterium]|nr:immunoglobulin domain-containing protein [Candidatus Polarisedimenticolia bacterium]